ncbi:MAG: hypothetical protein AB8B51_00225 [Sedimentitalea sp.]
MIKTAIMAALFGVFASPVFAEFQLSFTWGNIPLCNTGRPNRVGSPEFVIKGLPAGADSIAFKLIDLNVPSYKHGGGKIKLAGDGRIPAGVFKYKSPCPPGEIHTYEWQATARKGRKVLGTATARRRYPE